MRMRLCVEMANKHRIIIKKKIGGSKENEITGMTIVLIIEKREKLDFMVT